MHQLNRYRGIREYFALAVTAAFVFSGGVTASAVTNASENAPAIQAIEVAVPGYLDSSTREKSNVRIAASSMGRSRSNTIQLGSAPISLGLPFSDASTQSSITNTGVALYDNKNGSSTVVVPRQGNSLAALIVIDSETSPSSYEFDIQLAKGGHLEMQESGAVVALNGDSTLQAVVAPPWAKDSDGKDVPTRYSIDGTTLTQIVDLDSSAINFPVVADPWLGVDLISSFTWYSKYSSYEKIKIAVTPMMGFLDSSNAGWAGWSELKTKAGSRVNTTTYFQQFDCHAWGKAAIYFEPPPSNTWDLERSRRALSPGTEWNTYVSTLCNW